MYVRPTEDNARRVMKALTAFGFGSVGIGAEDFVSADRVVQLGCPPVRIDPLTGLSGVSWDAAWAGRESGAYGDVPTAFLGRAELVANKRACGRRKDQADLEAIGEE